jgi:thiol-disulfide isomerase/thioredoxin
MRLNRRSILWVLGSAALSAAAALTLAGQGPFGRLVAGTDPSLPRLKGEMGDFSYFTTPKPVPPIGFVDAEGKALALDDFKGRVVLVNFWATWCVPCVREMPSLDRLEARLGSKDFTVLDLSLDRQGKDAIGPYFAENKLSHLGIYIDPQGAAFHAWQGQGVPTSFLIGRDGRALGVMIGPADWDSPPALKLIEYFVGGRNSVRVEETTLTN